MVSIEEQILREVLSVALIALVVGLAVHALLRRRNPEQAWGKLGNVWTQPFGAVDLPVVIFLLFLFGWGVWTSAAGGEAPGDGANYGWEEAWFMVVFYVFLISALLFFLGFLRMKDVVEVFGLARMRPKRIAIVSVLVMVAVYPLVVLVSLVYKAAVERTGLVDLGPQEMVEVMAGNNDPGMVVLLIFSTCLVAPVVEEVLFRGYIYAVIKRFSDRSFSAIFTSTIFAVIHMNVLSLAPLWVLAMCFTVAYEVTGCLWITIAMHAIFNILNVILILFLHFPELM